MGTRILGSYPIFHLPPAQRAYLCHILNPQPQKTFMSDPTNFSRTMHLKMLWCKSIWQCPLCHVFVPVFFFTVTLGLKESSRHPTWCSVVCKCLLSPIYQLTHSSAGWPNNYLASTVNARAIMAGSQWASWVTIQWQLGVVGAQAGWQADPVL